MSELFNTSRVQVLRNNKEKKTTKKRKTITIIFFTQSNIFARVNILLTVLLYMIF